MQAWRCPACDKTISARTIHVPIRCSCGHVQRTSEGITGEAVTSSQRTLKADILSGPGTELRNILHAIHATPKAGCRCAERIMQMNVWGVHGCKVHRSEIVKWLSDSYKQLTITDALTATLFAIATGLVVRVSVSDPFGSLVDIAIHKAETSNATKHSPAG